MYIINIPPKARGLTEGVMLNWQVSEAQSVEKGQILGRIEAFGQLVDLECPQSGELLKILVGPGKPFYGTQPLALLGQKGEDVNKALEKLFPKAVAKPAPEQKAAPKPSAPQPQQPAKQEVKPMEKKSPAGKVVPILMPQAGQTMEEGTLLSWKVKEGDKITAGQVIFEIETDKATMEVEAMESGNLAKIVVAEGQSVPVKTPVAYLADSAADAEAFIASQGGIVAPAPKTTQAPVPQADTKQAAPVSQSGSTASAGQVKASPAARKLASEKGLDITSVGQGSGPGGRILSTDLDGAKPAAYTPAVPGDFVRYPVSKMRKAIAQNLSYSKQNIPHFYIKLTIEAQAIFNLYKQLKQKFQCSVNDFITLACGRAIRQYAAFRSQYTPTEIVENPSVNIGIAVGTDKGLTVPVLLNVDRMTLPQLAAATRQMAENARNGKVEGVGQGVFTITNLGMFGVEEFSAIINPPESAILAVGAIREDIKVENGSIKPTRVMTLSLAADHRMIDGVLAAQFMVTLKEMLEKPEQLVS